MTTTQPYSLIKLTHVATIQLNRPEVLNALNLQLMDELIAALQLQINPD